MKTSWVLVAVAALAFGAFFLWSERVPEPEMSVLFVGDSYTENNELPELVARVAIANGTVIEVTTYVDGEARMEDHADDPELLQLIADKAFDVVVLQERSEFPANEQSFRDSSLPSVLALSSWSHAAGSEVILFETWAHTGGSGFTGHDSFATMQAAVSASYAEMGAEAGATVSAVGKAWQEALLQVVGAPMHQSDGSHPTVEGSTLAAMVLAGTILGTEIDTVPGGLVDDRAAAVFLEVVALAPTLESVS